MGGQVINLMDWHFAVNKPFVVMMHGVADAAAFSKMYEPLHEKTNNLGFKLAPRL